MANGTLTITIGFRRWFKWWMAIVIIVNHLTGWKPSEARIQRWVARGVYLK